MVAEDSLEASTEVTQRVSEAWNYTIESLDDATSVSTRASEVWNYKITELVVDETLTQTEEISEYVFDRGDAVIIGQLGATDNMRVSNEPLKNTGESALLFESGTGVDSGIAGAAKIQTTEVWNYVTNSLNASTTVVERVVEAWNYTETALSESVTVSERVTEGWNAE